MTNSSFFNYALTVDRAIPQSELEKALKKSRSSGLIDHAVVVFDGTYVLTSRYDRYFITAKLQKILRRASFMLVMFEQKNFSANINDEIWDDILDTIPNFMEEMDAAHDSALEKAEIDEANYKSVRTANAQTH